jgi:hypothetical protein
MFQFVAKHRGIWPVALICEARGVSRSGFCAWLTRGPSKRALRDEQLGREARRSFLDSGQTYGARPVWQDGLAAGLICGLHRTERLMPGQALKVRPRRRRLPIDCGARASGELADNVLDRRVRGAGAEPQMGGRLHLHLDGGGLALRRGRDRPLLAPRGRLVVVSKTRLRDDAGPHDHGPRRRHAGDGALATGETA